MGGLKAVIAFTINKSYIVQELCEQRFNPANECQGSCHLNASIEKQSEQDKDLELVLEQESYFFVAFERDETAFEMTGIQTQIDFGLTAFNVLEGNQRIGHRPPPSYA